MSKQDVLFEDFFLLLKVQIELANRRFDVLENVARTGFDCLANAFNGTPKSFASQSAPYLLHMESMKQESSALQKQLTALQAKLLGSN